MIICFIGLQINCAANIFWHDKMDNEWSITDDCVG